MRIGVQRLSGFGSLYGAKARSLTDHLPRECCIQKKKLFRPHRVTACLDRHLPVHAITACLARHSVRAATEPLVKCVPRLFRLGTKALRTRGLDASALLL
jgi:hypothetical protein